MTWDLSPPDETTLQDRDVAPTSNELAGVRVALMVTGGIAAMRSPMTARALRRAGADVVAFVSAEAERYVGVDALSWSTTHPVVRQLSPEAEHLAGTTTPSVFLVAPATYNTINKMALGIADTPLLATLASALGRVERRQAAVLIAPTMHGSMHNSILTNSLSRLRAMGVEIITPKQEDGKNKLPDDEVLVASVCTAARSQSGLR